MVEFSLKTVSLVMDRQCRSHFSSSASHLLGVFPATCLHQQSWSDFFCSVAVLFTTGHHSCYHVFLCCYMSISHLVLQSFLLNRQPPFWPAPHGLSTTFIEEHSPGSQPFCNIYIYIYNNI